MEKVVADGSRVPAACTARFPGTRERRFGKIIFSPLALPRHDLYVIGTCQRNDVQCYREDASPRARRSTRSMYSDDTRDAVAVIA